MAKRLYEVEFKGQSQKYYFESKQKAADYALVVAGFGGKQYRIQAIYVSEAKAELFKEIELAQDFLEKVSGIR
jgi:hypothetical protein